MPLEADLFAALDAKEDKEYFAILRANPNLDLSKIKNSEGVPFLHAIIQKNRISLLEDYLRRRFSPNVTDTQDVTPLLLATKLNNARSVELLLESHADGNLLDKHDNSPFSLAFENDQHEILNLLTKKRFNPLLKCYESLIKEDDKSFSETALRFIRTKKMMESIENMTEVIPFHQAIFSTMKHTIDQSDLPLLFMLTIMSGNKTAAHTMIETHMIDPNSLVTLPGKPRRPLLYAVEFIESPVKNDYAKKLIAIGADPNIIYQIIPGEQDFYRLDQSYKTGHFTALEEALLTKNKSLFQYCLETTGVSPFVGVARSVLNLTINLSFGKDETVVKLRNDLRDYIIKKQNSLTSVDKQYQKYRELREMTVEAGHVLGLSATIPIKYPDGMTYPIKTEGNYVFESAGMIEKAVEFFRTTLENDYKKQPNGETATLHNKFAKIRKSMTTYRQFLSADGSVTAETLIKLHQDGNPVVLPVGLPSHGLSITLHGNKMIICNRGQGRLETGITILDINSKDLITPEFINTITNLSKFKTMNEILEALNKFGIDTQKRVSLPSKDQAHGTCSFVNIKSGIYGILYTMALQEGLDHDTAMKSAAKAYKFFTRRMRDGSCGGYINQFKAYKQSGNQEGVQVSLQIFAQYLLEHHGREDPKKRDTFNPEKKKQDFLRAQKILNNLDPDDKIKLRELLLNTEDHLNLFSFCKHLDPKGEIISLSAITTRAQFAFDKAIKEVDLGMIQYLLECKETREFIELSGALEQALKTKNFSLASLLLQQGANPYDFPKNPNRAALHSSYIVETKASWRSPSRITIIPNFEIMEYLLLTQGLDPEKSNGDGISFVGLLAGQGFNDASDKFNSHAVKAFNILSSRPIEVQKQLIENQIALLKHQDKSLRGSAERVLCHIFLSHLTRGTDMDRDLIQSMTKMLSKSDQSDLFRSNREILELYNLSSLGKDLKILFYSEQPLLAAFDQINPSPKTMKPKTPEAQTGGKVLTFAAREEKEKKEKEATLHSERSEKERPKPDKP